MRDGKWMNGTEVWRLLAVGLAGIVLTGVTFHLRYGTPVTQDQVQRVVAHEMQQYSTLSQSVENLSLEVSNLSKAVAVLNASLVEKGVIDGD